jgi:hypothetical protein
MIIASQQGLNSFDTAVLLLKYIHMTIEALFMIRSVYYPNLDRTNPIISQKQASSKTYCCVNNNQAIRFCDSWRNTIIGEVDKAERVRMTNKKLREEMLVHAYKKIQKGSVEAQQDLDEFDSLSI